MLRRLMTEIENASYDQDGEQQHRDYGLMPRHSRGFGCGSRRGRSTDLFKFRRRHGIADNIGIEIHHGNNNTVFDFEIAKLMQIRLPAAVFFKSIRYTLL